MRSSTAFTIPEKGLITEGLAYDPAEETFFVSSVHKRRILSVSSTGEAKTFASEQDGLFSVLGMSVDAKRRHLWVTSTAFPQMLNFKKEEDGVSAVFKFDLRTKKEVLTTTLRPGDLTFAGRYWLLDPAKHVRGNVRAGHRHQAADGRGRRHRVLSNDGRRMGAEGG